ncbi:hypothetical protein [Caldimonas tepidiphila]|uniref:hypothetical protein n=1 Tax=Caldimonas tepidiphila TaxID=2315841 RepID=UPI000E5C5130|nr:hypothetical protein [Caldimonas tepidiphila]
MNNDKTPSGAWRQRFTLAKCLTWPMDEWDDVPLVSGIALEREARESTAQRWLALRGVTNSSPDAVEVRSEALTGSGLLIALNAPTTKFLEWFRRSEWSLRGTTDDTDRDAWAWAVVDRARTAVARMGE